MNENRWKGYLRAEPCERAEQTCPRECEWVVTYVCDVRPGLIVGDIFGELNGFEPSGAVLRGPCPFHGGHDGSFVIDPKTLHWRCRSQCDQAGDELAYLDLLRGGSGYPRGDDYFELVRCVCEWRGASPTVASARLRAWSRDRWSRA